MRKIKSLLAIIILPVVASCSTLPQITPVQPTGDLHADLQVLADRYVRAMDLPGMGLLYFSKTEGRVAVAAGESDLRRHQQMTPDSAYAIGSTTKSFIAIILLQLIDENKLALDDSASRWFGGNSVLSKVTIRQLLTHTGGIPEYLTDSHFISEYYAAPDYKRYSRDDLIATAINSGSAPLDKTFHYSNTGYLILATIIEDVTGHTVGEELESRIFGPLGMKHTYYAPAENIKEIPGLATGYQNGNPMNDNRNYFLYNAAGGIVSTLDDMLKFSLAWMSGNKVLSQAARRLIAENYVDCLIESDLDTRYSTGLIEAWGLFGADAYGHGGATFGFRSEWWYLPQRGEVLIYFANSGMHGEDFRNLRSALQQLLAFYR